MPVLPAAVVMMVVVMLISIRMRGPRWAVASVFVAVPVGEQRQRPPDLEADL